MFSIGFGGLTLYAAPGVSSTIGALGMLYLIGNIVWHAGLLAKDYCLDEKTYNAKVAALKEHLTTEQIAEFIAGFFFSYIRDHFAQGILKYFISGIFKSASFIKQLNNIIGQQIKKYPPKPPKSPKPPKQPKKPQKPKAPKKQKKVQKSKAPKNKPNKTPNTKPVKPTRLPKKKSLGKRKHAARKIARRKQLQNKRQKSGKPQGASDSKIPARGEEGSHQGKEKAKLKKPFERQLQGAKPKLTQELKRRMEEAFKKLLEQYKDKIEPRIRDHIKEINLEHHFFPDSRKGSLSGYHNETFVETQIAKLIGKGKEGAKEARWVAKVDDQLKAKVSTIDPPHWGPLKTIEKVVEGMQHITKGPFYSSKGCYFQGMTKEGFRIDYRIDRKGLIETFSISAYHEGKWNL